MKYILKRHNFLKSIDEALKDEISKVQQHRVVDVWGESYLDYETIEMTKEIELGKFKLYPEDSDKVIDKVFNTDIKKIKTVLNSIPKEFEEILKMALDKERIKNVDPRLVKSFEGDWSLLTLTFKQVAALYKGIFRKIAINETNADEILKKDEKGVPIRDEEGNMIKVKKEVGEIIFTNNYVNINTFVQDYNKVRSDRINDSLFSQEEFQNIYSIYLDNDRIGDFEFMAESQVYLYISGDAKDVLNMSVSPFYQSCQELYKGGGHGYDYMGQLLSNVFDPNSVPAFLLIDTPYYSDYDGSTEKLSDFVALSRLTIRNMEDYEGNSRGLYFDQTYPDRMTRITQEMVEKYTGNKNDEDLESSTYVFRPALDICDIDSQRGGQTTLRQPYMDTLSIKHEKSINVNTRRIVFKDGGMGDYDGIDIKVGAKVKEVFIQSSDLPKNFFDMKLDIEWLKFQYMKINSLKKFRKVITETVGFDKCKIKKKVWKTMLTNFKSVKRISLQSIETNKRMTPIEFGRLENLEELELIYSFVDLNPNLVESKSLKKLTISGDMLMREKNKQIVSALKNKGVQIKTVGLVL